MKVLVKGNTKRLAEFKQKFYQSDFELICINENDSTELEDGVYEAIFDLNFDDEKQSNFSMFKNLEKTPVFVCAVKNSLAQMVFNSTEKVNFPLFGMNAIDTFINRNLLEISIFDSSRKTVLIETLSKLACDFKVVNDRVGMVTPRIVCMIINEACYTLQEGTASLIDIDTSMKLGTNYPFGPFEWADKMGIRQVYEILFQLFDDTKDERYKICSLLKTKYLLNQKFYS